MYINKKIKLAMKIFIVLAPLLFCLLLGEYQGYGPEKQASDRLRLSIVCTMYFIEIVFFITGRIKQMNRLLSVMIRLFVLIAGICFVWQCVN